MPYGPRKERHRHKVGMGYSQGANVVPVCDDNAPMAPCYTVTADAAPCATGEYLVQTIGADALTPGTMLELTCQ